MRPGREPRYVRSDTILVRAFTIDVLAASAPDAVSDVLRSLSVRSSVFCLSEMRAPWAFRVEGAAIAKFHLVLEGEAVLALDEQAPLPLAAGDLVVLARGDAHTVGDRAGSPVVALDRLLAGFPPDERSRLRYGGTGAVTRLLCGGFDLAGSLPESPLALLPDVLRVDSAAVAATGWLEPVLAALDTEARDGRPGSGAVLAKIADVFLSQALRAWLVGAERAGLLGAGVLHDQPVAKAVEAIRSRFAERWTVDRLAAHVGLSRTALSTRFRALVGESPIRYLTRVRLSHAAGYLATGRLTLYEVARLTGYDNDATLSKAFKREFGRAPGAYRAESRRPPAITVA